MMRVPAGERKGEDVGEREAEKQEGKVMRSSEGMKRELHESQVFLCK